MSTLVLALAAGIAVGSDPRETSAEVAVCLGLGVKWEGSFDDAQGDLSWAELSNGSLRVLHLGRAVDFRSVPEDEGQGKLRMSFAGKTHLGIYKHEGGCLLICLGEAGGRRPGGFWAGVGQTLLALRRVKPGK